MDKRSGEYVSGIMGNVVIAMKKEAIATTFAIHRQPSVLCTSTDPIRGPRIGPMVKKEPTVGIAKPRCLGVQISAMVPARIDEGAAPKKPCKKRRTKIVVGLLASATGSWRSVKAAYPASRGRFLPKHSLRGL